SGFVIYDEKDQSSLVEKLLDELHADEKLKKPLLNFIEEMKNEGRLTLPEFSFPREKKLAELFGYYQRKIKESNAMDFGDLLCNAIRLFSEHEEVRLKYEGLFRYIIVDEFQDTNAAQYKILRLLTRGRKNICVVGDDDQSIYSWRGARIENILSFDRDYFGARVVKLEKNYRSTQMILSAASELVSRNAARHDKRLYSNRESGERLQVFIAADDIVEAKTVASKIMELRKKYDYGSIAVLYRTNAQSRLFEDVFRALGIPYVVVGALMFYARAEIKDILAYLKVLVNPYDAISFLRIINKPARGIGAKAIEKMAARAAEKGISLFDAFMEIAYDSDDKL
ncbi:MAG: UvrD-helicase domain-containing protein, partial [Deltaproteobacteria bacterium]|nr:UvrD-helicase domain-containing protein [Deltaproteobacteria bacterium]